MTIERRYCARHPIDLPVSIRYRKRRFICAHACNMSNQGMFLEVRNLTLPTGILVELELECLGKDWLIPALVVHHRGSGIGVMFRDPQPALYQALTRDPARQLPPPQAIGASGHRSSVR
ncbi:PilZ domain-containing protein [Thiocapsa marina]|uniref:Type IV pilus assembly PilZ n=1 Tax=Thiocapsa marina 5811 TaxID=768671 RepID=F9U5G4_9GAMM|nr:PilZ domain-containing protein [Thiocapsa marina]EGV20387.1 type IV pilus assembly PilZ [Thiocapsa marina 5811]